MNNQNSTNGIPDEHAFAVGQATGVNINGSAMCVADAVLHNSSSPHQNSSSEKINNESNGSDSDNVTNINQLRSNKKMTLIHRISV